VVVEYLDVKKDAAALQAMLQASGGRRSVPVIVEEGRATVGFGGS
jgi:glutaredoxin